MKKTKDSTIDFKPLRKGDKYAFSSGNINGDIVYECNKNSYIINLISHAEIISIEVNKLYIEYSLWRNNSPLVWQKGADSNLVLGYLQVRGYSDDIVSLVQSFIRQIRAAL